MRCRQPEKAAERANLEELTRTIESFSITVEADAVEQLELRKAPVLRYSDTRLAQMRKLVSRFSAEVGAWPAEGWTELRLMPQPIYCYANEDGGVIDGAIVSLAVANDPEVLIQLELTRDTVDGVANWSYSIARVSAIWMKARCD